MPSSGNTWLELTASIVASAEQISCEVADERVILSLATGEYYGLNTVAADIWDLVQQQRTVEEVRDALLSMYDGVTESECTAQLLETLAEMHDLQLIRVSQS